MEMEMALPQRGISVGGGNHSAAAMAMTCRGPGPRPATPPPVKREHKQEQEAEGGELRRGPWTVDEDMTLVNYIADHGEGRWNALARAAGLKRTGKSCRLRWLNYLRPDVKRGDFTADEQLLILDLHSRWGNRWSKIAAELPGRTDNEIKNYWRTRVQKHAKQLNCDVNSARFKDAMRFLWMPRLAERAEQLHASSNAAAVLVADTPPPPCISSALTTMAAAPPAAAAEGCFHHSPTGSSSCGHVAVACTTSSSSDSSSLTSESTTTTTTHEEKSVQLNCCDEDWAAAAMQQQQQGETTESGSIHDLWSSLPAPAMAMPQLVTDDCLQLQFQDDVLVQDLSGWVQGFSEGIISAAVPDDNSLWSLDDMIWRMQ